MLLHVRIPNEPFNTLVRDGDIGEKVQAILQETRPEVVYFTNYDGQRGAIMIVEVQDPSQVPALAEPWYLLLDADVQFHVVMTPEDLTRANLDEIGKKWEE